jgi:hypothetical protein
MYIPKAIAALTKWADTEESRYPLRCVRLRRAGGFVFAEATDGRRLCRLTWASEGPECEYRLEGKVLSKALKTVGVSDGGYFASLNGDVTLYGRNVGTSVTPTVTDARWPRTEDALYPPAKAKASTVGVVALREQARAAIKAQPKAFQLGMDLEMAGVKVRLDAKYVRDMAETAIQSGYDEVHVSATDKQSAVHFWAYTEVKFEAVIMPLAAD